MVGLRVDTKAVLTVPHSAERWAAWMVDSKAAMKDDLTAGWRATPKADSTVAQTAHSTAVHWADQ